MSGIAIYDQPETLETELGEYWTSFYVLISSYQLAGFGVTYLLFKMCTQILDASVCSA